MKPKLLLQQKEVEYKQTCTMAVKAIVRKKLMRRYKMRVYVVSKVCRG
jgi:hypothetical protein